MKIILASLLLIFTLNLCAQTPIDEVRVYKSKHQMDLLAQGKIIKSYRVMLGRGGKGPKRQEGDKLVPEGTYYIDYKNPYSEFYKSLHISYPNSEDIKRAEEAGVSPGGDIMIHGYPNNPKPFFKLLKRLGVIKFVDWTAGCVAVNDTQMEEIYNNLDEETPITIYH